jgi:hypothetical protein
MTTRTDPLTVEEIISGPLMESNPEAASLAIGMVLMQRSSEESHNIMTNLYEQQAEEIKKLRRQNAELAVWARAYWRIRGALELTDESEDG